MIPAFTRSNQQIGVLGLGVSGISAAHALEAGGATVFAWDEDDNARKRATNLNIPLTDPASSTWRSADAIILSPGISPSHPVPAAAAKLGTPIIGDIELFSENVLQGTIIGITGTNGKSTTASLIFHILQSCGLRVQIGGNFGPAALELNPPSAEEIIVLELSSYQLELTSKAMFDIAVVLNVTPDHIERHGSMERYVAAKKQIFRHDTGSIRKAVIGIDDIHGQTFQRELIDKRSWEVIPISISSSGTARVSVINGMLRDSEGSKFDLSKSENLRGPHNWQNAAAAWAVSRICEVRPNQIREALKSFTSLPHRLETIAHKGTVQYVNDSKATNGQATAKALASFKNIYWIAGGVAKEDGIAPTIPYLNRVIKAFLIGEAAESFKVILDKHQIPSKVCNDLQEAVESAQRSTVLDNQLNSVVLLSPACASFDQYSDFLQRGEHFKTITGELLQSSSP